MPITIRHMRSLDDIYTNELLKTFYLLAKYAAEKEQDDSDFRVFFNDLLNGKPVALTFKRTRKNDLFTLKSSDGSHARLKVIRQK